MVIVHTPDLNDPYRYGHWVVVGDIDPDFDPQGFDVTQVTPEQLRKEPFIADLFRYWEGPHSEKHLLLERLLSGDPPWSKGLDEPFDHELREMVRAWLSCP